ncbi:MAG: hypothetical protein WA798_11690 [Candidatus Acidiferrum sp.]
MGAEEGLLGVGVERGAIVSWSTLRSFESIVAAAFRSSAPPQEEQNRLLVETCAPQEEQYMGSGDSIIVGWRAASEREGSPAKELGRNQDTRSTCTAVP